MYGCFHYSLYLCLPPLNKKLCVRPVQVSVLPLQLLAHGALQCLVIPVIVSLLAASKQIGVTSNPCGESGEAVCPNFVMSSVVRPPECALTHHEEAIIQKCFS